MRAAGRRLAHHAADVLRKRLCLLFRVVRQDDAEFLATDPSEDAPSGEESLGCRKTSDQQDRGGSMSRVRVRTLPGVNIAS